jgi:hypothetical protein
MALPKISAQEFETLEEGAERCVIIIQHGDTNTPAAVVQNSVTFVPEIFI